MRGRKISVLLMASLAVGLLSVGLFLLPCGAAYGAHPGGGGGGGGWGGSGHSGGWGGGGWGGHGWGGGYYGGGWAGPGYNGYYYQPDYGTYSTYQPDNSNPAQAYTVQSPIQPNPQPAGSGAPIKIVNPASNSATLSYTLDGRPYSIPPGSSQDLVLDHPWVIEFNRGGSFGTGQYSLESAVYTFTATNHGWELFQSPLGPSGPAMPATTMPPSGVPANPLPGGR